MPHVSVYVDESGDVGFADTSSKIFTIGYAFIADRSPTKENKTIKRALKNINAKSKMKLPEFKFSADSYRVRRRFLDVINRLNVELGVFCISKDSVKSELKEVPHGFYRFATVDTIITHLVEDYMQAHDQNNSIRYTIDKSLAKNVRDSFNEYCENKIHDMMRQKKLKMDFTASIYHEDSRDVPMLQVADYIASATQKFIVHGDATFYNAYNNKLKYREKLDCNDKIVTLDLLLPACLTSVIGSVKILLIAQQTLPT